MPATAATVAMAATGIPGVALAARQRLPLRTTRSSCQWKCSREVRVSHLASAV
jgi:hypothetical protein